MIGQYSRPNKIIRIKTHCMALSYDNFYCTDRQINEEVAQTLGHRGQCLPLFDPRCLRLQPYFKSSLPPEIECLKSLAIRCTLGQAGWINYLITNPPSQHQQYRLGNVRPSLRTTDVSAIMATSELSKTDLDRHDQ